MFDIYDIYSSPLYCVRITKYIMKKTYVATVAVIVVLVGILIASPKVNQQDYVVKIANLPIVEGLPLYIALDKGYFKDAGIKTEYIRFDAPNQIIDAVISGKVDMVSPSGAMGISAIAESKNPGSLKIYAAAGSNLDNRMNGMYVKTGSSILKPGDVKGLKLGILPGIQWRTIATEILSKEGLVANKDVTLVELAPGLHVSALESGQVDALLALEPAPTVIKGKDIGREILPSPTLQISNPFYAGAGIINAKFMETHPELAKKALEVMDRAIADMNANPEEYRKHLKGYTALTDELIESVPMPIIKSWKNIQDSDIQAIQKFYEIFSKHKVVETPLDFKTLLYK